MAVRRKEEGEAMCGIVGVLVKDPSLEGQLGALLVPMLEALSERGPDSTGVAIYRRLGEPVEIVKDVGPAPEVCHRYGIAGRTGYQGIGHTRMATESAVTARHSHPFSPAPDLCVVHNGSFSNHASVRRRLQAEGVTFDTDNDSEVAARYIGARLATGDDLEEAMRWVQKAFDGFFTLLVTTATQFAVVRDNFACKPATVAETDRYVAMASEYRALAHLPGIADATVFEPAPGEIYTWTR
jgi:methylamine---glutamate N-methyltransferase subunit A